MWCPPEERPRVFGDRNRIIQVFLNLGLNAIEATDPERGEITVSMRPREFTAIGPGSQSGDPVPGIEVELSDNGTGMPGEELRKMLTPFFTTKASGSGLGLCIVERIIREHMGVVNFSSRPDEGTDFRIWLPVIPQTKTEENANPTCHPISDRTIACHA